MAIKGTGRGVECNKALRFSFSPSSSLAAVARHDHLLIMWRSAVSANTARTRWSLARPPPPEGSEGISGPQNQHRPTSLARRRRWHATTKHKGTRRGEERGVKEIGGTEEEEEGSCSCAWGGEGART